MPELTRQIRIRHRVDEVFELVSDIGRYPEFIRWIHSMKVTNEHVAAGIHHCRGEASIGFKGFSERFATDVAADPVARTINVELARGPFRRLNNKWKLSELAEGETFVEFYIDYEFRNPVLAWLALANTDLAVNKVMQAFIEEADRRYHKSG